MPEGPRLLVLFSHPLVYAGGAPITALDTESERETLWRAFVDHEARVRVRFDIATSEALRQGLLRGCDWLHWSGHGAPDALAFEDGRGAVHGVAVDALRETVKTGADGSLDLAFVSACHSEAVGRALIAAGVRHVVAVELEHGVLDRAATVFAGNFYRALAAGRSVQNAFDVGKDSVKNDPQLQIPVPDDPQGGTLAEREADKFRLLPDGVDHAVVLCDGTSPGPPEDHGDKPVAHNLPSRRDDFVGRAGEMWRVIDLLLDGRLVTIRGAPGIGKTQVATEIGRWFAQRRCFPHGVWFVNLREMSTADAVRVQIAFTLGIRCEDDAQLAAQLAERQCLLILDNLEDALHTDRKALRSLLSTLLQGAPGLKLLVTSREPIGAGLPAPERVEVIPALDAVASALLFAANSQEPIDPRRLAKDQDFDAIYRTLGGHPLSLSIVASHYPILSLPDIREALAIRPDHVLEIDGLAPDDQDVLTSVTRSLDLSLHRLEKTDPPAVRLFGILSLLPGGALPPTLDAVAGVDWSDPLRTLVRHSLAERDPMGRVTLLPAVLLYADRCLADEDRTRAGLAALEHLAGMYRAFLPQMFGEHAHAIQFLLSLELPNALACLQRPGRPPKPDENVAPGSMLASAACDAALKLARLREAEEIIDLGIDGARAAADRAGEADCLTSLGDLRLHTADLAGAQQAYDQALPLYREIGERLGEANTLQALGDLRLHTADLAGAQQAYDEALPLYREIGDRLGEANTYDSMGKLGVVTSEPEEAVANFDKALAIYRVIGDRWNVADTLLNKTPALLLLEKREEALAAIEEAESLAREIADPRLLEIARRARSLLEG